MQKILTFFQQKNKNNRASKNFDDTFVLVPADKAGKNAIFFDDFSTLIKSPRTSSIVQIILSFWSFEINEGFL